MRGEELRAVKFLQQFEGFILQEKALAAENLIILFERSQP